MRKETAMGAGFENLWSISVVAGAIIVVLSIVLFVLRARGTLAVRRLGRLSVIDFCEVDKARRLVIVRRDNVEHLLLIGGAQDLLIEKSLNIAAAEPELAPGRLFRNENGEDAPVPRPGPLRTPHLRAVPPDGDAPTEPTLK
jgi:hypothetical protein